MRLDEGSIVASATSRQLESLNCKGEILVVGVVNQEPVVERLLQQRERLFGLSGIYIYVAPHRYEYWNTGSWCRTPMARNTCRRGRTPGTGGRETSDRERKRSSAITCFFPVFIICSTLPGHSWCRSRQEQEDRGSQGLSTPPLGPSEKISNVK